VATVLKTLETKLPLLETGQLIPNALHPPGRTADAQDAAAHAPWLGITAKRHDEFAALLVKLDGTLDRWNAAELLKRLSMAANKAGLDIIVDFEHLKHATPDALKELVDAEALKAVLPHVKLHYRKLRAAFDHAMHMLPMAGNVPTSESLEA
jgi:hypothetical protein